VPFVIFIFKYDAQNYGENEPHIVLRHVSYLVLNITHDAHYMNEKFVMCNISGG